MRLHTPFFRYGFHAATQTDTGRRRASNQDVAVSCPAEGFYAVSDGMGGLPCNGGGITSHMIGKVLPLIIRDAAALLDTEQPVPEHAAELLEQHVRLLSDNIYDMGNSERHIFYGATLSGVWLVDRHAVFVNLGDSRGYYLPSRSKKISQVTADHNLAALLVDLGELSKAEAGSHPSSSQLLQFAGMPAPAKPDVYVCEVRPGDRLLVCSDGLYGMVDDARLPRLMRSAKRNPDTVCRHLIGEANAGGGRDNISAVYLKILK